MVVAVDNYIVDYYIPYMPLAGDIRIDRPDKAAVDKEHFVPAGADYMKYLVRLIMAFEVGRYCQPQGLRKQLDILDSMVSHHIHAASEERT